jgi:hypothetical protein
MLNAMKKTVSVLLAFAVAVIPLSCKSFDPKLLEQAATFDKSVTPMRVVINTDSIKACFRGGWRDIKEYNAEFDKIIAGDRQGPLGIYGQACCSFPEQQKIINLIKQNLMFGKDSKIVYMSVLVRNIEWLDNSGWLGLAPLGIFWFFGMPWRSMTATINMEAAVMNSSGKIIKIYKAWGKDTEYLALYWGYFRPKELQTAYTRALLAACADLRKQIEADRENINKLIK